MEAGAGQMEVDASSREVDAGPMEDLRLEANFGTVGNEMEVVERSLGNGDAMDIDLDVEVVEPPLCNDDEMDVDVDADDLNGHIRHLALGVANLELEFLALRITYLS